MTAVDHGRPVVVVLLVVLGLLVPSIGIAQSPRPGRRPLQVSTDRMQTPTAVTGTYDAGPAGATYDYRLGGRVERTASMTGRRVALSTGSLSSDGAATRWTVAIQARLGSWTGTPYTRVVNCPPSRP